MVLKGRIVRLFSVVSAMLPFAHLVHQAITFAILLQDRWELLPRNARIEGLSIFVMDWTWVMILGFLLTYSVAQLLLDVFVLRKEQDITMASLNEIPSNVLAWGCGNLLLMFVMFTISLVCYPLCMVVNLVAVVLHALDLPWMSDDTRVLCIALLAVATLCSGVCGILVTVRLIWLVMIKKAIPVTATDQPHSVWAPPQNS